MGNQRPIGDGINTADTHTVRPVVMFRAWDKRTQQMFVPCALLFSVHPDNLGQLLSVKRMEQDEIGQESIDIDPSDVILMQYSGLNDKNGVMIFEDVKSGI